MKIRLKKKLVLPGVAILVLLFATGYSVVSNGKKFPHFKGDYLGKTPPGKIPKKFDTGQITGDSRLFNLSFSPDGNELFFSYYKGTKEKPHPAYEIKHMKRINNIWQKPQTAFFSGKYSDCDITISPDGQKMFFAREGCMHPVSGKKMDIYYIQKTKSGWSEAIYAGSEVNSNGGEVHASLSNKGNLFFRSDRPDGNDADIYKSEYINGKFTNVKKLGPEVNSKHGATDCFIDQEENFVLYNTFPPEFKGKPQIYVSFQIKKDRWTKGQSLGTEINSKNGTMGSIITADGKYLFYVSRVGKERAVYWVSTDIIKDLKKKILKGNKEKR